MNRAEVLGRLFLTSLHWADAITVAPEIEATSAGTWPVAFCDLCLIAFVDSVMPDPDSAWSLVCAHARADPTAKVMMPRLEMLVAAVLGRVGMTDSARAVIRSGLREARGDPDFDLFRAGALVAIGAKDSAVTLLEQYVHANPAQRLAALHWRWFEPLGGSPLEIPAKPCRTGVRPARHGSRKNSQFLVMRGVPPECMVGQTCPESAGRASPGSRTERTMRTRRAKVLALFAAVAIGLLAGCRKDILEPPPSPDSGPCYWIGTQYILHPLTGHDSFPGRL